MARRRRHPDLPSVGVSPQARERAEALARRLAGGGELPWAPVPDLHPGEVGHAFWPSGTWAASHSRPSGGPYVPPLEPGYVIVDTRVPLVSAASLLLRHNPRTSRRRSWRPVAGGVPLGLIITSQRVTLGVGVTIPLASITAITPWARDRSAVEITSTSNDPLMIWGEHVPYAATLVSWLVTGSVAADAPAPPRRRG